MQNRNILVVEDTDTLADLYTKALQIHGFIVNCVPDGHSLFETLDTDSFAPSAILLDLKLPDADGLDILEQLKLQGIDIPVVMMTGHASINIAIEAMQRGACDFLIKPFPLEKMTASMERAISARGIVTKSAAADNERHLLEARPLKPGKQSDYRPRAGFGGFIGLSKPMQQVYEIIESAAKSSATVFITGESGTGKEVCAEAIHKLSKRAGNPFVAINCAAIPRELLESELFGHVKGAFTGAVTDRNGAVAQAEGGTLFLDGIAEMAPEMQSKLLRFLQGLHYRKVGGQRQERANIRIVCATNRDPRQEIANGTLRQDLYYRLHVIPIHMPPLRERRADILDLADYYMRLYAREEYKNFRSYSAAAERLLLSYTWPGNVRELQNVVRGAIVMHDASVVEDFMLPTYLHTQMATASHYTAGTRIVPLWQMEKIAIEEAISHCEGNIPKAAALLEISPSTIYRKKMFWDKHGDGDQPIV